MYRTGNTTYHSSSGYQQTDWYDPAPGSAAENLRERLAPLLDILGQLDAKRVKLERFGGDFASLNEITEILNKGFSLESYFGRRENVCTLVKQKRLRSCLSELSGYTVHLDVRTLHHGIPVYYCCRTREDYYSEYGLVVEDLYRSPGFPVDDDRFVRLRTHGREKYWLRLSQFRDPVVTMLGSSTPAVVDRCIYNAGRWVFSAAWNESQRPSRLAARCLDLEHFFQTVECLHLALTSDPCELRVHVDSMLLDFFTTIYEHKPIRMYLSALASMSGERLDRIWKDAYALYRLLASEYTRFLKTEVQWGLIQSRMPLWKLLFGNYSRMQSLSDKVQEDSAVREASAILEKAAVEINELLLA